MGTDKIVSSALKRAFNRITTPIIVETTRLGFRDVIEGILPFVRDLDRKRIFRDDPILGPFINFRKIDRFNMFATILTRDRIFDLAEERNVVKVFPDRLSHALQFPTVGPNGVFEIQDRKTKKYKTLTTTFYTKSLLGLDQSPYNGRGVKVAVLDTGGARIHEQNQLVSYDSTIPQQRDENGHGTWCGTCIGGGQGISEEVSRQSRRDALCEGMATGVDLHHIKCLGYIIGTGSTSGIIKAIEKAIDVKAKIISMSLGATVEEERPEDDAMYLPILLSVQQNMIPVIAAGNEGPDTKTIGSPGIFDETLTVGAYSPFDGSVANFSSRGPTKFNTIKPDVIAPGVNILSGSVGLIDKSDGTPDRYSAISGTSMATPHISGLVAHMVEAHKTLLGKDLTLVEIQVMMEQLGVEKNNTIGWGIMDWPLYQRWLNTQYGVS